MFSRFPLLKRLFFTISGFSRISLMSSICITFVSVFNLSILLATILINKEILFNLIPENEKIKENLVFYIYYLLHCNHAVFVIVISIVETILDLFSPSLGGISAVPIAILVTFKSLINRLWVISATSTAVVIAWR